LAVYTDVPGHARTLLPPGTACVFTPYTAPEPDVRPLLQSFFGESSRVQRAPYAASSWRHLLVSGRASGSQYERLIRLAPVGAGVPHGVACIARTGSEFQGFRGRSWVGSPGNLHLSVHLAPQQPIARFESVFMALAAVSVVEAIEALPGLAGRARIKWVNDVLIDGAKVAGVLAHTQTRGATVTSVVLGIGLNVETTPAVRATAFVPAVASLREFAADPASLRLDEVLHRVLHALDRNYRILLSEGYAPLVERYRARSAVLDEEVLISSDDADEVPRVLAAGRVVAIGDGLELRLAGHPTPVTRGRLILPAGTPRALAHHPSAARQPASTWRAP
jgi:biotin-[acetyl-CoA-carboxylase] ligase BirA-like protein